MLFCLINLLDDIIKYLSEDIISIVIERGTFSDYDCYEHNDMWNNYSDNSYYYSDNDIWADIAGLDDPDDMETEYWNLD